MNKKSKVNILDVEKLRSQIKGGLSVREIAKMWDIPYTSLARLLKKEGVIKKSSKKNLI